MKANDRRQGVVTRHTWYGLKASMRVGPWVLHRSGFFGLMIPHPGLANWLLRLTIPEPRRSTLSLAHEFGHFQTLPLMLLYAGGMLAGISLKGHFTRCGLLFSLAGSHAAWEMASELFAITQDKQFYRNCYTGVSIWPRTVFWALCVFLVACGWILS